MHSQGLVPCLVLGILLVLLHPGSGTLAPMLRNTAGSVGGQYLIKIKEGFDVKTVVENIRSQVMANAGSKAHFEVLHEIEKAVPVVVAKLDFTAQLEAQKVEGVEFIEEDGIVREEDLSMGQDTKVPKDYGLDRINQKSKELDGNLTIKGDGFGVNIYILDTGVQDLHRDFECRARHAYDALGGSGYDDCTGHGTAVAGVVAGKSYGVATGATLHSVKVMGCEEVTDSKEYHTVSYVTKGIDWVVQNKVSPCVVVLALSSGGSQVLDAAVKTLHDTGCVVVAAAGNNVQVTGKKVREEGWEGSLMGLRKPAPEAEEEDEFVREACTRSPARSPYVITAAAVDTTDTVPAWSNTGLCVDLFAPGEDIYTLSQKTDDDFLYKSGTAMATAYVAGVAAIHLGNGVSEVPDTVPFQIANEIIRMTILRDADTCKVDEAGEGTPNRMLFIAQE